MQTGRAGRANLRVNPFNMAAKSRQLQSYRISLLGIGEQWRSPKQRRKGRNARLRQAVRFCHVEGPIRM
jgi:hypothetical protein